MAASLSDHKFKRRLFCGPEEVLQASKVLGQLAEEGKKAWEPCIQLLPHWSEVPRILLSHTIRLLNDWVVTVLGQKLLRLIDSSFSGAHIVFPEVFHRPNPVSDVWLCVELGESYLGFFVCS